MGNRLIRLAIVVLGWTLVVRTGFNVVRLYKAGDRVTEAKKELLKAQQKNEELKKQLALVKTPEYMERQAREKLGYGKEGELVVVIAPEDLKAGDDESVVTREAEPNWKKWRKLYLGF